MVDKNALEALCKPSKDGGSMANVLFAANIILTSKAARFGSRRVWLFTDEDEPGTKEAQKSAITRARDLNDLGIRMEFRFFDKPGKPPFDRTKFYDDIFYKGDEEEGDYDDWRVPLDPVTRKESLLTWVRSKQTPKRSQFNILMELGPGMEIGIKGFILFKRQEAQRSHYVYAQEEKLAIAHVESADIDPVSPQYLFLIVGVNSGYPKGGCPKGIQIWRRTYCLLPGRTKTYSFFWRTCSTNFGFQTY